MTRKDKKFTKPFFKKKGGWDLPIANQSTVNIQTAIALHQKGKLEPAEQIYQQLLVVNPINSEVLHLLGVIAYQRGQFQHAIDLISIAIEISPDIPDFFVNKGNALQELKLLEEAILCYEQAIVLNPNYAEAYINMGAALKDLSRLQEAIKSFDKAILLRPDLAEAHSNRGIALKGLNDFQSAIASYDKAIAINPNYAEAHYNRGISLQELKQLEAAVESYDRAIAVNPAYAEAYANRGAAYKDLKKIEAAIDSFDKAFEINPDMEYLIGMRQHARMFICDWDDFDNQILELRRRIQLGIQAITCLSAVALPLTAKEQLEVSKVWVRNHHPYNPCLGLIPKYANSQKIRIGYFSADFQNHATAHLMAELFELHDKDKFELIAFSFGPIGPGLTHFALSLGVFRHPTPVALSVQEILDLCILAFALGLASAFPHVHRFPPPRCGTLLPPRPGGGPCSAVNTSPIPFAFRTVVPRVPLAVCSPRAPHLPLVAVAATAQKRTRSADTAIVTQPRDRNPRRRSVCRCRRRVGVANPFMRDRAHHVANDGVCIRNS
jgi:tetratricopeptide (TPR) repeat protein